jgi:hypothetical protein
MRPLGSRANPVIIGVSAGRCKDGPSSLTEAMRASWGEMPRPHVESRSATSGAARSGLRIGHRQFTDSAVIASRIHRW